MSQAGEPSVEEILESIKKVIARDNRAGAAEERRVRESRGVTDALDRDAESGDDVLELAESAELADSGEGQADGDGAWPLIAENTRSSISDSLAALAMLAEPGVPPQIVRSGETSLEGMARELLRPALTEWLEKNLPALVERMVASEIARIVGKKG